MFLNIRSIKSREKKDDLEAYLLGFSMLPILIFCETWLLSNESNVLFPFANEYTVYRCDRDDGRRGGGVCILIPRVLKSMTIPGKVSCTEYESVWCRIVSDNKSINLGVVYRPPDYHKTMPTKLIDHLDKMIEDKIPTVLFGDFNYGNIDWNSNTASNQYGQNKFLEFMTGKGMTQYVNFHTRNEAILDLVFTNEPLLVQCVELGMHIERCDHETVIGKLAFQTVESKTIKVRSYKTADYTKLNRSLLDFDWKKEFSGCNLIEQFWIKFVTVLMFFVNRYIPQRTIKTKCKPKQSKRVKRLCRKAWSLHKKYKITGTQGAYQKYLAASQLAQHSKREQDFESEKKNCRI